MTINYFQQANQQLKAGELKQAIASYQKAIEKNPNFAWYYQNLADALAQDGQIEQAIATYEIAIQIKEDSAWSYYKLGKLLLEKKQTEQAIQHLQRAIDIQDDVADFYVVLGKAFIQLGNWSEAEQIFQSLLDVSQYTDNLDSCVLPQELNVAEIFYHLGLIKAGQKKWLDAIQFYMLVQKDNINEIDCDIDLADALSHLGRCSEAIEYYSKTKISKMSGESLFLFGKALQKLQRWEDALIKYKNAIALGFTKAELHHNLGYTLSRLGHWREASDELQTTVNLNPKSAVAWQNLGDVLSKLKAREEAIDAYNKALEIDPKLLEAKLGLDSLLTNKLNSESVLNNSVDLFPEWDTRNCLSITSTDTNISIPDQVYIFPAIIHERNTTRYRVNHLTEICNKLTKCEVIDYKNLSSDFFQQLNKNANIVVIVQRLAIHDKDSESFMNRLRQTSALIVYEIDDQIFDSNELESWRIEALHHRPEQYYHCMQYADQFLVSTKELRKKIEAMFNRPVHVLQNLLNDDQVNLSLATTKKTANHKFIIGYASGSATHDIDLNTALNALDRFLSDYPNVQLDCIGDVNLPEKFLKKHSSKVVIHKKVHWKSLPDILAKFTIQIIPLATNNFNCYKSQIRYLESSVVGVPVLASRIGEQSQTIIQHYTGYLCENTDESWYEGLKWYYDNQDKIDLIGNASRSNILKYWTNNSPFRIWKLKNILQDFTLGAIRDKISIILVIYNPLHDVKAICESIINHTNVPFELLIWINSSDLSVKDYIRNLNLENVYVVDVEQNVGKAFAANHLFRIAVERFVVGLDDDYIVPHLWSERMIHSTKAIPKLGWLSTNLTEDSSGIRGRGKIATYNGGVSIYVPGGVGGWVIFTTASAREKIGLYTEHGLYGGIDGDYNRRARNLGLITGYVRNVVGKHKTQRKNSLAWELFKQRIQDKMRVHGKQSDDVKDKFVDFFKDRPNHLTCAIKICTSIKHDENVWGDTHYAIGLKSALEKLDYEVRIDKHEEWYDHKDTEDDIVIHLFGLHKYKPNPGVINILWIISHVDLIDKNFLLQFDYIFCTSEKLKEKVCNLVPHIRVETLLQCTDINNFYPVEEISKDIDIAFIGNSRRVYRKSIKYAVEIGLDISIWGTRWEEFIDVKYIKGQSLPSDQVSDIYRRAKIVLNDHWDDQIDEEIVNNRIFDVLACNTLVISDYNPGISKIFVEDPLPTFKNIEEFKNLISFFLESNSKREKIATALGQTVREYHTFNQRAQSIHKAVIYIIENYVDYKSELLYNLRNS